MRPSANPLDFGFDLIAGINPFRGILPRRPARAVATSSAPAAIGPYSQAIAAGGAVFCSGQLGLDPATMQLAGDDAATQTRRALENLSAVLAAAGLSLRHVVKTTIFLVDMTDFAAVNAVYATFFPERPPARSTFAVAALPLAARVEIEAIALGP
jgi:2-iminobutanoate/2-iminopropanoate deaminase